MAAAKASVVRKVFLSSTTEDLGMFRGAVFKAISGLDGFQCVRQEDFGARDWKAEDFCRARVRECQVFVGALGPLYGSSPKGSEKSFTEIEHEEAVESGIPRLLFLTPDGFATGVREPDKKYRRQKKFRDSVKDRIVAFFDHPEQLAKLVVAALRNQERELATAEPTETRPAGDAGPISTPGADVDPAALRASYLSRLLQQVSPVPLGGIDPAAAGDDANASLSLDAVYTALLTLTPLKARKGPDRLGAPPDPGECNRSALELLNQHRRLVFLGDPGGGKSTFVNFVALCLAGEALGQSGLGLDLLRAPLPDSEGNDEKKPQPWDHGTLLPVRIVLRDFAARGLPAAVEEAKAKHLWDFLEMTLEEATLGAYVPFLYKELQETGGLVLLDGLDEVPDAEVKRQQIRDCVEDFAATFSRCRILLTSRTYAYQNQGWTLRGFTEATLAPFSKGQIRRFVSRWYAQVVTIGRITRNEAEGRSDGLLQAIFGREHLRELAVRPLLLTLMASLHAWRGGELPEKREELYAETVDLLLDRWERHQVVPGLPQPSLAQYLAVGKDAVRAVLEELAFDVHRAQGDQPGTADVAQGDLMGRLMDLRRAEGANPAVLLKYLSQRAGILIPRGVGVYTFAHRTFQEYLAARHLTETDFPTFLAELGREDPDRWREVVLLAGAKAARGSGSTVWHLAHELCFREPDEAEAGLADAWGAHLAGQVVAESVDLSRKIGAANEKQLELLRRWHVHLLRATLLPAPERALAGKTLAKLGDPRFDPERWFLPREALLGFVEVPAGAFLMGGSSEQHKVNLPPVFIARYPVTVGQFGVFLRDSGNGERPETPKELANQPITGVTWHVALAYCRWLTEKLREEARSKRIDQTDCSAGDFWASLASGKASVMLPSEAEWEKAARGTDGRGYPWGLREGIADPERANYCDTGILKPNTVGCFPRGASPYGCEEMSGNVWEWTRSLYKDSEHKFEYPYDATDGRENLTTSGPRVLRGGACYDDSLYLRCGVRNWDDPLDGGPFGFRVVVLPFFSGL